MKDKTIKIIIASILVVAIVSLIAYTSFGIGGKAIIDTSSNSELDVFARCLSENKVVMYGTEWCSYCNRQKELFGNSFREVTFIDCDKNKALCQSEGITGYPTWKVNGNSYPGLKTLTQLSEISGCLI
jgi:glutaredoxin